MTPQTVTHHPVRSDVGSAPAPSSGAARTSTRWALAGLGAGITGAGAIVASLSLSSVYDESVSGDTTKIAEELSDLIPNLVAFHVLGMVSATLMIVFAAGLHRRLRATAPAESIAPLVATFGLLGTAFVLVMGTGLDTEFIFGVGDEKIVAPDNAAFYNHWVATIPWCWGLLGLSGIALFVLARTGSVARWLGIVGLVGGGLTLLVGISPLQYMAGFTGPIGLVVVALGFLVGDREYKESRGR